MKRFLKVRKDGIPYKKIIPLADEKYMLVMISFEKYSILKLLFMQFLRLPATIRSARPDEVPNREDVMNRIHLIETANIIEGFSIQLNDNKEFPFNFYSEINVDNDKLWLLFKTFLLTFPDEISFIFGHIDHELVHSKYLNKFELLNTIENFELELTQDTFLEFGVIFENDSSLREFFVTKEKYVKYWGVNGDPFFDILRTFSINQVDNLNFIDEFPNVRETLSLSNSKARNTQEVIDALRDNFLF